MDLKKFTAKYGDCTLKIRAVSASKAILTAAKILGVKPTKVSVRQN